MKLSIVVTTTVIETAAIMSNLALIAEIQTLAGLPVAVPAPGTVEFDTPEVQGYIILGETLDIALNFDIPEEAMIAAYDLYSKIFKLIIAIHHVFPMTEALEVKEAFAKYTAICAK